MVDDEQSAAGKNEPAQDQPDPQAKPAPMVAPVAGPVQALKPQGTEPGDGRATDEGEQKRQRTLEWNTKVQAWCSVAIAIFALGQVIVGYWQWDATRDQYDIMRADQRPWVSISIPKIESPSPNGRMRFAVSMHNSGRTPATVVEDGYNAVFLKDGIPQPGIGSVVVRRGDVGMKVAGGEIDLRLEMDKLLPSLIGESPTGTNIVIAPGSDEPMLQSISENVSDQQSADIKSGAVMPVIIVRIRYLDAAGESHATWGVFIYVGELGVFLREPKYAHME